MPPSTAFSLLPEAGSKLLAGDALLSLTVLKTHVSPNRGGPVSIVGIVVVQRTTVARVANANIVGVPGARSPAKTTADRVTCSLLPIIIRPENACSLFCWPLAWPSSGSACL